MIIIAKFASTCPKCSRAIAIGSKVEWSKGAKASHVTCPAAGSVGAAAAPVARPLYARRAPRGRWNGCSCGARELPGGGLSANACASCRFDEYDS
jgi:hypothetical protein